LIAAVLLCLSLLCPFFSGQAGNQPKESFFLALLPDRGELAGWAKEGDHQFFEGDDLFIYIDGGAEIYFEYGFRRVIVQDYRNVVGRRLSLEIFEMQSPDSAYGMFTFKSSPGGEAIVLGDQCQLEDYYLNLCQGRYLVTITGLDQESVLKEDLVALARLIEGKLDEHGQLPGLVSLLPREGLKPLSLKFFKGPLALYNSYPFSRKDLFAFQTGIRGDYATGVSLFLFEYGAEETASGRLSEAHTRFSSEPKYRNIQWDGARLCAQDDKGRAMLARHSGRYIAITLSDNREAAEALLARAEKNLAAKQKEGLWSPEKTGAYRRP
jgi:hypothetical protein